MLQKKEMYVHGKVHCITVTHVLRTYTKVLFKNTNPLKVPKREIFDRSDFPDSYTIKSLRVCDFGVKIERILKNI